MKILIVLFVALTYAALLLGLSIAIMVYGWGLEPKSWWWIIGGYAGVIGVSSLTGIIQALSE